ncbi:subtilase family protein [Hirsutella rhossiliensis]|uniref:Subtilase family domain-containing protein n=1 Tax=Hirsutella rhossiliensis TaxID=111463 RepID=A0A9P8SNF2_9HYPO|nr:subtilase family domain-containing protein [Hirsutella rhossiliensis]KAH0967116.1 subtilase family domain-containing protein [Hirsutella rhossiliensis]
MGGTGFPDLDDSGYGIDQVTGESDVDNITRSMARGPRFTYITSISGAEIPQGVWDTLSAEGPRTPNNSEVEPAHTQRKSREKHDGTALHSTQSQTPIECKEADHWKLRLKELLAEYRPGQVRAEQRLKVAILDSGIDLNHPGFAQEDRIKKTKSWVGGNVDDTDGHGTHIAGLILELTQNVDLYIAKITTSRDRLESQVEKIATAIDYARTKWKVNMMSLSFGFEKPVERIKVELDKCICDSIIIFAAASNDCANSPATYPAAHGQILSIHSASAGKRHNCVRSAKDVEFVTVGECLESSWPSRDGQVKKYMSGTSFATPVAVSIAAFMLGYIDRNVPKPLSHRDWIRNRGIIVSG